MQIVRASGDFLVAATTLSTRGVGLSPGAITSNSSCRVSSVFIFSFSAMVILWFGVT